MSIRHFQPELKSAPPNCSSLDRVRAGTRVRIKQITAPDELSCRLREIGLCENQIVTLITSRSNLICQVCNSRLALSHEIAQEILVEPVILGSGRMAA